MSKKFYVITKDSYLIDDDEHEFETFPTLCVRPEEAKHYADEDLLETIDDDDAKVKMKWCKQKDGKIVGTYEYMSLQLTYHVTEVTLR